MDDVVRHRLTLIDKCVHVTGDSFSLGPTFADHCVHSKDNMGI